MIVRPCPNETPCLGDDPLDNFSSEADDSLDYISTKYTKEPPIKLLKNFKATQCNITFVSDISQLDADLMAAAAAFMCMENNQDPKDTVYFNAPQTCCVPCPDGSQSCFTVPGGLFPAFNQASADSYAYRVACDLVASNRVCISNVPKCTCVGSNYSATLTASVPVTWSFGGGSLPPGLVFSGGSGTTATITGIPTTNGSYTFEIKGESAVSTTNVKTMTISVLEITTTSLPPYTVGVPYSFQLVASGGSGSYQWLIASGVLPDGLTLSISGLISGTPTASGVNPVVFKLIDLSCESEQQSVLPPRLTMTTRSTTQIATLLGFSEYSGFTSSPPKKYKTLTWEGTSESQLWKGESEQIAGASFEYAGSSTIDASGNYTSLYTKNLSEMCNANQDALTTCFASDSLGGLNRYTFPGWFGPSGHQKCAPPGIPYLFVSNRAIGKGNEAINDSSALWGSKSIGTSGIKISDFNAISATQGFCLDAGGNKTNLDLITLFEPVPPNVMPQIDGGTEGIVWFFAGVVWNHDYTSSLSNEYTDAEAMTNARVILGNGATAQNLPRTTGFVSTFTNVVFTISCSTLIIGQNYLVSVDFWDSTVGTIVTRQYGFTADAVTHSITDIIPTPSVSHSVTVRNPRIVFSP